MEHRHRSLDARVLQVFEEISQVLRHDHALVDDGGHRQAGQIEHRIAGSQHALGAAARQEQLAVELVFFHVIARGVDEDLLDDRQRLEGLEAARLGVGGQQTPAGDLQSFALELLLELLHSDLCQCFVLIEEHQARGKLPRQLDAGIGSDGAQEARRRFEQQAATVTGLAVRGDSTAMGEPVQRRDGGLHQPIARLIVEVGDQAKAATVLLVGLAVQTLVQLAVHHITFCPRCPGNRDTHIRRQQPSHWRPLHPLYRQLENPPAGEPGSRGCTHFPAGRRTPRI